MDILINEIIIIFFDVFKMLFQIVVQLFPVVSKINNLPYEIIAIEIRVPTIVVVIFAKICKRCLMNFKKWVIKLR